MEFHARFHPFSGHELAELVAISPDDAAMQQVSCPVAPTRCCAKGIKERCIFWAQAIDCISYTLGMVQLLLLRNCTDRASICKILRLMM
jgi:hypothetical protein